MNLISTDEFALIQEEGIPPGIQPDLICKSSSGAVSFTAKGKQWYEAACAAICFSQPLDEIRTVDDLLDFHREFRRASLRRAQHALSSHYEQGGVGPADRAAVEAGLFGSLEDLETKTRQTFQLSELGKNIIVLPKKSSRDRG